jgi:hypothetical protein
MVGAGETDGWEVVDRNPGHLEGHILGSEAARLGGRSSGLLEAGHLGYRILGSEAARLGGRNLGSQVGHAGVRSLGLEDVHWGDHSPDSDRRDSLRAHKLDVLEMVSGKQVFIPLN